MNVRRAVLPALVALAATVPSGAARADHCPDPPVPCEAVLQTVDDVITLLNMWCDVDLCIPPFWTDAALCPILFTLGPGVPPTVGIGQDGDVYLDGHRVYDCPPYDWS